MAGLTHTLAEFIRAKTLSDCPEGASDRAKKVIADSFAAMLSGVGSEVAPPLFEYLKLASESGTSPVLGTGVRTSAELAALVNGTFGHALDFDDVLSMMPAHPSVIIVAALLSDLERMPLSGRALIEAHAIAIEIGGKIGAGMTVEHYGRGFHGTGTLGIFCAVAALAKAWGLETPVIRSAFGIASSMASGLRRNFGTMTKPLHTGWAARSALASVRLAMSGFTAAHDVLEAKAGFFAAYGTARSDPALTAAALGRPWVIVDPGIALKKYPCCYASHRAMDGVLTLRETLAFRAADIVRLECRMPPGGMQVLTYPRPATGLEAKFSLDYALAAGALDGIYTLWTFTDEAVKRPAIAALLERVRAYEDPRCRGDDPLFASRSSGSRGFVEVEVELRSGRRETVRIDKPPGHPARELTWSDLEAKFYDCARQARLAPENAQAAFSALRTLEAYADMRQIVTLMCR